jgi:hypothetical protein
MNGANPTLAMLASALPALVANNRDEDEPNEELTALREEVATLHKVVSKMRAEQRQMALLQKQMDTHQRAIADTVLHIANVLERLELIADEADEEVYEEPPRRPPARPAPPPAKPLRRGPR